MFAFDKKHKKNSMYSTQRNASFDSAQSFNGPQFRYTNTNKPPSINQASSQFALPMVPSYCSSNATTQYPLVSVVQRQLSKDKEIEQKEASLAIPLSLPREVASGVQGTARPLPHFNKVQQAFGRHDLSHVQAYTGSNAIRANRAIGAQAYATGNKIAFSDNSPSLHTVAHEATHIIQQQRGVQLKGGIGEAADKYEQQADAVADAVVQGKSTENLLKNCSDQKTDKKNGDYLITAPVQMMRLNKTTGLLSLSLNNANTCNTDDTAELNAWLEQLVENKNSEVLQRVLKTLKKSKKESDLITSEAVKMALQKLDPTTVHNTIPNKKRKVESTSSEIINLNFFEELKTDEPTIKHSITNATSLIPTDLKQLDVMVKDNVEEFKRAIVEIQKQGALGQLQEIRNLILILIENVSKNLKFGEDNTPYEYLSDAWGIVDAAIENFSDTSISLKEKQSFALTNNDAYIDEEQGSQDILVKIIYDVTGEEYEGYYDTKQITEDRNIFFFHCTKHNNRKLGSPQLMRLERNKIQLEEPLALKEQKQPFIHQPLNDSYNFPGGKKISPQIIANTSNEIKKLNPFKYTAALNEIIPDAQNVLNQLNVDHEEYIFNDKTEDLDKTAQKLHAVSWLATLKKGQEEWVEKYSRDRIISVAKTRTLTGKPLWLISHNGTLNIPTLIQNQLIGKDWIHIINSSNVKDINDTISKADLIFPEKVKQPHAEVKLKIFAAKNNLKIEALGVSHSAGVCINCHNYAENQVPITKLAPSKNRKKWIPPDLTKIKVKTYSKWQPQN